MTERSAEARVRGWRVPINTTIRALFDWCAQEKGTDRLLLAVRLGIDCEKPIVLEPELENTITAAFGDRILARKLVRKWPGSELIGHAGIIYEVAFDPSIVDSMARLGPRLEDWQMNHTPSLPEDPCLFSREADWPALVSVTHEGDAWILSENRPPFCTEAPFAFKPENLLVPPASQGFVSD